MFQYSEEEKNEALVKYFNNENDLKLMLFPKKQKQKYLCFLWIISLFAKNINYTEKEVNEILKKVYPDYVMIRRYLVDYGLISRTENGSSYWI